MSRRHDQVFHEVGVSRLEPGDPLSAALLRLVDRCRNSLDVSEVCERYRYFLLFDQVFIIKIFNVVLDLCESLAAPLFFYLEQLVFDDSHKKMLICEQRLVVSDPLHELCVLSLDLLTLQTLQSGKSHIEDSLCLDL